MGKELFYIAITLTGGVLTCLVVAVIGFFMLSALAVI